MRSRFLARPGRHVVLLFAVTILAPGLVLAAFSLRVIRQDEQLALRAIDQQLDRASRTLADAFDRELASTQVAMTRAAAAGFIDPADLPDWMREGASIPGRLVISLGERVVWPERAVAYLPWPVEPALEPAEPTHAQRLNRRARALRAADPVRAAAMFRDLAGLGPGERIGLVPADFAGRHGLCAIEAAADRRRICALELHAALSRGDWLLDKPLYLYYMQEVRGWLHAAGALEEAGRDLEIDRQRRALAAALSSDDDNDPSVLVVRTHAGSKPPPSGTGTTVLLALQRDWIRQQWQARIAAASSEPVEIRLIDDAGARAANVATTDEDTPSRATRHALGDHQWRLEVRPRDLAVAMAGSARLRTITLGLLAGVVTLLLFGTYFTGRVVRRELAVARMQSDFVSAVSHEFRSPLTGIRQLSEMLVRGRVPSEERRREYYARIAGESDRLARVIENILDFSRMEDGRKQYRFERIDADAWLDTTVERLERTLAGGNHRLDVRRERLGTIVADREALTTVIDNLVDNAVKYSPAADRVTLTAAPRNGEVRISVTDAGIGILPADRPHIFERFYRGAPEATQVARGTGIGLSLVDHIVRAHRGRVDVDTQVGRGSTFTVVLPADAGGALS